MYTGQRDGYPHTCRRLRGSGTGLRGFTPVDICGIGAVVVACKTCLRKPILRAVQCGGKAAILRPSVEIRI
jgi:hypothetical protein